MDVKSEEGHIVGCQFTIWKKDCDNFIGKVFYCNGLFANGVVEGPIL